MNCQLLEPQELEGLLLVRSKTDLSAAFLVPHLVQLALSANLRVVLVMVQDSLLHYQSVLRKLGMNLAQNIEAQRVIPINALASVATPDYFQHIAQQLVSACKQPQQPETSAGVCVLIDSASALAGLSCDKQQWQALLHYCQVPPASLQGQYACVMSVHSDVEADTSWISWLRHQAQTEVEVVALESGASQDINGQVVVTRRQPPLATRHSTQQPKEPEALQAPQQMNFKLGPSDIRFFR